MRRMRASSTKVARRYSGEARAGAHYKGAGTLGFRSPGGVPSAFSVRSILSVASVLSIGSAGSILSIGSTGSVLSIGSAGSILSIGSVGSILSVGAAGAILNKGRGKRDGDGPGGASPARDAGEQAPSGGAAT